MISSPELSADETEWKQDSMSKRTFVFFFSSLLQFILAGNKDNIILSPKFEYKKKEKEKIKK